MAKGVQAGALAAAVKSGTSSRRSKPAPKPSPRADAARAAMLALRSEDPELFLEALDAVNAMREG